MLARRGPLCGAVLGRELLRASALPREGFEDRRDDGAFAAAFALPDPDGPGSEIHEVPPAMFTACNMHFHGCTVARGDERSVTEVRTARYLGSLE